MSGDYMLRAFGYVGLKLILLAWLCLLPLTAQADLPLIAMDGKKIVTASTVRVRSQPSLTSSVVGHVNLGEVVPASKRTKDKLQNRDFQHYWYLIQSPTMRGWVSGRFLTDFQAENKAKIWFALIKKRLDNPNLSFRDRVALYKFTDLVVKNSQGEKLEGAFELGKLLALQKSFELVNFGNHKREPYASWIATHQSEKRVFPDEVSGEWLVPANDYWVLADKYKGQASGDEIAWYAANARLGGECEGDISCNLGREEITQGEYLKRYPLGRYANASLKRMSNVLEYVRGALKEQPDYFKEMPDSGKTIESLVDIIKTTNPKLSERPKAVEQIKAIQIDFNKATQ